MDKTAFREEIKFRLTGGVLELELDDVAIDRVIDASLREIQRYIDTVVLITVPYKSCIDTKEYKINSVTDVFREEAFSSTGSKAEMQGASMVDPMVAMQWQMLSGGGGMYNFQSYMLDYAAYNTMLQIRNTTSTDLAFVFDKYNEKLYINVSSGIPNKITIGYIPRYDDVSQIVSDYWIDMTMRLAVAIAKVTLGRVRSRYTSNNALWTQDGETLLEEGNAELTEIRNHLTENTCLMYGID